MIDRIQWLGHGSFRVEGPPLIYINPWRIARTAFHADVILISNDQYDHCSPADIDKLCGPHTLIITNANTAAVLDYDNTMILRPWQSVNIGSARITAIPAYTFTRHNPVSRGGLGFIISMDYYDIYYAGSTDVVPELGRIQADVAILPVGAGQGTMPLDRTVDLINQMHPSWVIPSHWGTNGGTYLDAQALARALDSETNVVLYDQAH
ncbi:MAG: MBL fold metallo-hydrolase [Anaerolineae bacterium]|jgi:L-ascorbate metabolism protein UlaG (beta-lactamase superfamily)|nr:MBL fold metallo-hydrolase [Anaerolineae bacterium]